MKTSPLELRARVVVASIQALVMVVAVGAFFARLFVLEMPAGLEDALKWGITLVSAPTLVVGALLCVRLETGWRWLGLLVLALDIAAYTGAGLAQNEARKNLEPQERLRNICWIQDFGPPAKFGGME